jgi:hypothetical protein
VHERHLNAGGGPAANLITFKGSLRESDNSVVRGGISAVVGMSNRDGFFTELKVGLLDSPSIKLGVGVTFGR